VALAPSFGVLLGAAATLSATLGLLTLIAAAVAGLATLAAGFAGLLRIEFVRSAFLMCGAASLRSNFALLFLIHGSEPTIARIVLLILIGHCLILHKSLAIKANLMQ
jgi:hypothetical protein